MYNFVFVLHVVISILLVVVILIQRGRGGGLVEALSGAESLFGTKTSAFLVKVTTVLAIIFFITSMSLAFLSKQRQVSILERTGGVLEEFEAQSEDLIPSEQGIPQSEDEPEIFKDTSLDNNDN
jgi:preprotein translocase subunit SecG